MDLNTFDKIFNPRRIALLGVTPNPQSVGGKILSNLVGSGFQGVVYPVNPTSEAVLGIPCYPSVLKLPKTPDLALICAPAPQVPDLVRECGEAGIRGLIINSAGFREAGEEGAGMERRLAEIAAEFPGMQLIGPNCLGIIVPRHNLNASFAQGMPRDGHIAFISQSGALCSSVLDWALEEKIGFSYFVSVGNMVDVDFADLIDYFGEDAKTKSIILYIESISNARKFMSAVRSFAYTKPIIAYKAGRFPESAAVAASHTGALVSEDAVYEAAFERVGLARVRDIGEIFACAELIGRQKIPRGPNLGIITNAGGPGVMATDALIAQNGRLALLSEESMAQLNAALPPIWSRRNPVDVLGDARSKRVQKAAEILLKDPGVDALLVIITPQAMTNTATIARVLADIAAGTAKPILAAWLGGVSMREGMRILAEAGVATYATPEQAVRAFMTLVAYARNRESLYQTPKDIPVQFPLDREELRLRFRELTGGAGDMLPEDVSKSVLDLYGIPTTRPVPASTEDEAERAALRVGYPVVMKILSPDISHKSDVGGVALDLEDEEEVRHAWRRMIARVREKRPAASIEGVTIQRMIRDEHAVEIICGIKKDPVFGTTMMVGAGGTAAELFRDRALGFPPLNERLAMRMLESLTIWPLLRGYRGKPPVDLDKLVEALIRLSYLAANSPEIRELDVNPLLASPDGVIALDARILLDRECPPDGADPYAHLALHPYPEEYVFLHRHESGADILFRPIRPEDEPLWLALLGSCSKETIYTRFRSFYHWETHDVAARYCYIDYDREIAIVAEQEVEGNRTLLGVGRMIADPDRKRAEYAVLVRDAWQNKGLGSLMTQYCLEVAQQWGVGRIVATTTPDNHRMIAVFEKLGFTVGLDESGTLIEVEKALR